MYKSNSKNESDLWDEKYRNSREYESLDDYLQFSSTNPTIKVIEPYIKDNFHILEIGSGTGELISYIKNKYTKVHAFGVDFSDVSIDRSKKLNEKFNLGINFTLSDIEKIHFEENTFHIIFGDQVVGHVSDINKALFEIRRILKPGGYCFLSTANKLRFDGWDMYKKISENHHGYTQRSFFPWKFKNILVGSNFRFVSGYGDMIFLMRNFNILKYKFFKEKTAVTSKHVILGNHTANKSIVKKVYNYIESIAPWWTKISIGIIVKK